MNSALASIAKHRAKGFKEALVIEKSKRQRGKKLNLTREPSRKAQFFKIAKVLAVMRQEDEKVKKAEQGKAAKEKAKEDAKVAKEAKEALKQAEKAKKVMEKEQEKVKQAEQKEIDA